MTPKTRKRRRARRKARILASRLEAEIINLSVEQMQNCAEAFAALGISAHEAAVSLRALRRPWFIWMKPPPLPPLQFDYRKLDIPLSPIVHDWPEPDGELPNPIRPRSVEG